MKKFWYILVPVVLFVICDYVIAMWFEKGLDRYFGLDQDSEILLVGHSHLMLATDKEQMEHDLGMKVSKFCREGVDVSTRKKMIEYYLSLPYKDSLKYVLYGVDLFTFQPSGLSKNVHTLFYPFMDNEVIDRYIHANDENVPYWSHKLIRSSRYSDALFNSALRGHMNNWTNYKTGILDIGKVRKGLTADNRTVAFDSTLIQEFEQTIELLKQKKLTTILINTPTLYELNMANEDGYNRIDKYFDSVAAASELVYYWNLNSKYSQRYDLFFDMIHMNDKGQEVVSKEITNRLKQLR